MFCHHEVDHQNLQNQLNVLQLQFPQSFLHLPPRLKIRIVPLLLVNPSPQKTSHGHQNVLRFLGHTLIW